MAGTSHFNLKKPAGTDRAYIADINSNMDTIDANLYPKVTSRNGNPANPEVSNLRITGSSDAGVDVLQWGAGQDYGAANNAGGILYSHSGRQYTFRAKNSANSVNVDYKLPGASSATEAASYDILTSKDFPFARQGGASPGGNTNAVTFTAPGTARHAIILFAAEMVNLFHASNDGSTIYSGTLPSGWTLTRSGATYTLTRSSSTVFRYVVLWI